MQDVLENPKQINHCIYRTKYKRIDIIRGSANENCSGEYQLQDAFENLEKEGEQITLEVSDRIYSELQEGDCGSLSCRDGKLVSFGALQNRDDRERSFRG